MSAGRGNAISGARNVSDSEDSFSASAATLGASNRLRIATSTLSTARIRLISRVASRECPPSSKKLSSTPTAGRPSTAANSSQRIASCGLRGARCACAEPSSGSGSARRSSLPFGVSGSASSAMIACGTM